MNKGLKIDYKYENPIDIFLLKLNTKLNPIWYKLNFSPNILTTFSLLFTLIGLYLTYNNYYLIGGILYFIGYFFDCADGNFARTYNLQTKFGDYYDHLSDLVKIFLLIGIFFIKVKKSKRKKIYKIFFLILFLGLIVIIHLGCQQLIYFQTKKTNLDANILLNKLQMFCPNVKLIKYTRYFGAGTIQVILTLLIIFFPQIL